MASAVEIVHEGRISRFVLRLVERKTLHGFKRRLALDEHGNECASALLTRDGRFLLPAGSTAETYLDSNGDGVKRDDLAAVDANGNPLPTLPATTGRSQVAEEVMTSEDVFDHVVTKVYALEAETLDPILESKLHAGAIFRIPYRPRLGHMENPAFLMANEQGIFLVQAEACRFEYVGLEQTISETDEALEDADSDDDEFTFDLEADHAVA